MPSSTGAGKTGRAREASSRGREPSSRTKGGGRSSKVVDRDSAKNRKSSLLGSRKALFLPLLSVWVLALVILAGLIYWGLGSGALFSKSKKTTTTPPIMTLKEKTTASRKQESAEDHSVSLPAQNNHPSKPHGSPILEAQENFTSRDIPDTAVTDHSSADQNTRLALNSPGDAPVTRPPVPPQPAPPVAPSLAMVAIVIDDLGQDLDMAKKFLAVPLPLTFSVLPHQRHSKEIAELAHSKQREVILHLPMQPRGYPKANPGDGALLLSMTGSEIQKQLRSSLDSSPYFTGMNNHMGSRFTESAKSMKIVLSELRHRGLYFLDSSTSPLTVGYSLAQQLQVPTRKRDVFLDNSSSEDSIRSQVNHLIRKAKIEGTAIAIGHPHESTLRVLLEEAGRLRQEGISVVPAGELIATPPKVAHRD